MPAQQLTAQARRSEDLLIGVLATLAMRGVDTFRTTDKAFHRGFGKALEVFRSAGGDLAEPASQYHKDIVSHTFDELDHALIAAEKFGLVRFPNPSYSRVQIAITPRVAERLLREWSELKPVFEAAADTLYRSTYDNSEE